VKAAMIAVIGHVLPISPAAAVDCDLEPKPKGCFGSGEGRPTRPERTPVPSPRPKYEFCLGKAGCYGSVEQLLPEARERARKEKGPVVVEVFPSSTPIRVGTSATIDVPLTFENRHQRANAYRAIIGGDGTCIDVKDGRKPGEASRATVVKMSHVSVTACLRIEDARVEISSSDIALRSGETAINVIAGTFIANDVTFASKLGGTALKLVQSSAAHLEGISMTGYQTGVVAKGSAVYFCKGKRNNLIKARKTAIHIALPDSEVSDMEDMYSDANMSCANGHSLNALGGIALEGPGSTEGSTGILIEPGVPLREIEGAHITKFGTAIEADSLSKIDNSTFKGNGVAIRLSAEDQKSPLLGRNTFAGNRLDLDIAGPVAAYAKLDEHERLTCRMPDRGKKQKQEWQKQLAPVCTPNIDFSGNAQHTQGKISSE